MPFPMILRLLQNACLIVLSLAPLAAGSEAQSRGGTRLVVLTDISSLTAGVREPDDGQSMIRLMLYTNEIDVEGLIASSNMQHGQVTRPELIREVINAYSRVRPKLLQHDRRFPPVEKLAGSVKSGQPVAGPKTPVFDSIGPGKDTEASDWIIRAVDRQDPRPVWVAIWGGSADLAQALWKVKSTRTPEQLEKFVAKLRVHSIGDQDSTGAWIKQEFPTLVYLTQGNSMRGMYRGGDTSLASADWVEKHIHEGRGALGALYPNYNGGDIWGSVKGVKEGDTPSFLGLIPNGLSMPEQPELGGWGGRFQQVEGQPNDWRDAVDDYPGSESDRSPGMATVYRWRAAYQADFEARLDWCVQPRSQANHAPVVRIRGGQTRRARPGGTVSLDATATDPDGDRLTYEWSVYPGPAAAGKFGNAASPKTRFALAPDAVFPVHLLLAVRDSGHPALTRYARVILDTH